MPMRPRRAHAHHAQAVHGLGPAGHAVPPERWVELLEALGRAVRRRVVDARRSGRALDTPLGHDSGDTIYAIDRAVEPVIRRHIRSWPETCKPLTLIAEGMGQDGVTRFPSRKRRNTLTPQDREGQAAGVNPGQARFTVIIDPIDGTRLIMLDKRSAWFLAAVAPQRDGAAGLGDAVASVAVELPTSKAGWADTFSATKGGGVRGRREALSVGPRRDRPIPIRPSTARTLQGGFSQVVNVIGGVKVLAAELMERILARTVDPRRTGDVFDDQYCTGGQMLELMLGHDRFCCDLRPLFYRILAERGQWRPGWQKWECHPYDCGALLLAREAGVILTDAFGQPLNPPLDVHSGVHWCGYANDALCRRVEPVIRSFLAERGVTGPANIVTCVR
jgi:fructose-1,6-bisphosphatase/inositol monophosphatase family enzyme